MTAATLSYKDRNAWGLTLNPSFDELAQSTKKHLRIPQPNRAAKWFALSNYRAFMLLTHLKLDYDSSGAPLQMAAAMLQPAPEGQDPAWDNVRQATEQAEEHDAYEVAFEAMNAEHRQEAARMRAEHLASTHTLPDAHWFIGGAHRDLEEAGVEHDAPLPRPQLTRLRLPAPVEMPAAAGQIGAIRPFPTFEQLNLGQPRVLRGSSLRVNQTASPYEQMRDNALGR